MSPPAISSAIFRNESRLLLPELPERVKGKTEGFFAKRTKGFGYLYEGDGSNNKIYIVLRDTLEVVTSFGAEIQKSDGLSTIQSFRTGTVAHPLLLEPLASARSETSGAPQRAPNIRDARQPDNRATAGRSYRRYLAVMYQ
jgi:hypothetical protein